MAVFSLDLSQQVRDFSESVKGATRPFSTRGGGGGGGVWGHATPPENFDSRHEIKCYL